MSLSFGQIRDRALDLIKKQYDALFGGMNPVITDIANPYDPDRHRSLLTAIAQAMVEHLKTNAVVSTQSAVTSTSLKAGKHTFSVGGANTLDINFDFDLLSDEYGVVFDVRTDGYSASADSRGKDGFTLSLSPSLGGVGPDVEVYWMAFTADTPFGKASGSGSVS